MTTSARPGILLRPWRISSPSTMSPSNAGYCWRRRLRTASRSARPCELMRSDYARSCRISKLKTRSSRRSSGKPKLSCSVVGSRISNTPPLRTRSHLSCPQQRLRRRPPWPLRRPNLCRRRRQNPSPHHPQHLQNVRLVYPSPARIGPRRVLEDRSRAMEGSPLTPGIPVRRPYHVVPTGLPLLEQTARGCRLPTCRGRGRCIRSAASLAKCRSSRRESSPRGHGYQHLPKESMVPRRGRPPRFPRQHQHRYRLRSRFVPVGGSAEGA